MSTYRSQSAGPICSWTQVNKGSNFLNMQSSLNKGGKIRRCWQDPVAAYILWDTCDWNADSLKSPLLPPVYCLFTNFVREEVDLTTRQPEAAKKNPTSDVRLGRRRDWALLPIHHGTRDSASSEPSCRGPRNEDLAQVLADYGGVRPFISVIVQQNDRLRPYVMNGQIKEHPKDLA